MFAHPHLLWLLLLLPLLALALGWRRRRGAASVRYPHAVVFAGLPSGRARLINRLRVGARLTVLALLIVGLARPRWPDLRTRIPAESTAIQMVLDISGSMAEKDFLLDGQPVTRLEAAKHAFQLFVTGGTHDLPGRSDDMIGLLTFAARSEDVCPPTLSHSVIMRMLDEATPQGTPPDSATNIGDAIAEAVDVLRRATPKEKLIILLSDGEHNVPAEIVPHALNPRQAARIAQGLGVRIHTIVVGSSAAPSPQPSPPHVAAPFTGAEKRHYAHGESAPVKGAATGGGGGTGEGAEGEEALKEVAEFTGGRSFRAHDVESLLEVCRDIDQLERTPIESFQYYRYHEAYPWVGLAGIVLLLWVAILEATRWLKLP